MFSNTNGSRSEGGRVEGGGRNKGGRSKGGREGGQGQDVFVLCCFVYELLFCVCIVGFVC